MKRQAAAAAVYAAEIVATIKERAQLRFLAAYSRDLFSTVQSTSEYNAVVGALELPRPQIVAAGSLGKGNYGEVWRATVQPPAPATAAAAAAAAGASAAMVVATTAFDADHAAVHDHHPAAQPSSITDGTITYPIDVAVKSRLAGETDPAVDEALLVEALVLHALKHDHILGLVGISTSKLPFLVATEHMVNGDLKTYLRACRPTQENAKARITLLDVSMIAERIAKALAYLESVSVVHRDVAARNVLVGKTTTEVKLGDLGAARSVFREVDREYTATSDHMPARWMALESLKAAIFSNKSDVWGFGVLCWELTTMAQTPYGIMGIKDMIDSLTTGTRLEEAPLTPPGLYKQMLLCWSVDPKRRPRFANLVSALSSIRGALAVTHDGSVILGSDSKLGANNAPLAGSGGGGGSAGGANSGYIEGMVEFKGGVGGGGGSGSTVGANSEYIEGMLEFEESPYSQCTPIDPKHLDYHNLLFKRVATSEYEIIDMSTSPFGDLGTVATLGLATSSASMKAHSVCRNGLDKVISSALQFADLMLERGKGMGLTRDQIASIHAYTQDSPLYVGLNGALGGWGPEGRAAVAYYLP